ncbi:MAG: C39 family peptidase [Lachnospiraceae bacterium]|nr:C39 family peptidase [Lachnospiraceae bacterium]
MERESSAYKKKCRRIRQMREQRRKIKRRLALAMFFFAVLAFFLVGKTLYGIGRAFAAESGIWKQADSDTGDLLADGGPDEAAALEDEMSDAEKETYIQEHAGLYTEDLLELLGKNAETLDYVYHYPELSDEEQEIDLSEEAEGETLPLLLQWDARWGYASYGDGLIGYTGCAPTCLSMVAIYLTGEADYTPLYIAEYAEENGYYISGKGTDWSLINSGCLAFGIQSREQALDEASMKAALDAGHTLVCSVRKGDFTDRGHFIVLTGYTDEGFTLNDPNSIVNSSRAWTYEELSWQIRKIWKFSKA